MSTGADGFDVDPTSLRDAAGRADHDASDVEGAGRSTTTALDAARTACGGPLLAAALLALSHDLSVRSGQVAGAVRAAGGALHRATDSYESVDRSAGGAIAAAAPPGIGDSMFGGMAR